MLSQEVMEELKAMGMDGALTGEHGIGLTKAKHMPLERDPAAMETMRTLKRTLNPNDIFHPGKMALDN